MRKPRQLLLDAVVILILAAVGVKLFAPGKPEEPPPAPSPAAPGFAAYPIPGWSLADLEGGELTYTEGGGPLLIMLSAVGCADCLARFDTDRAGVEMAHAAGLPVWHVLLGGGDGARAFRDQAGSPADRYAEDPSNQVIMGPLRGNDSKCWLVVDRSGQVIWQGGADLGMLERALAAIPPRAEAGELERAP